MIELVDTFPDANVQPAEYKRLLGFPRDIVLKDRSRELAEWARSWYAKNGRPWVYARQIDVLERGSSQRQPADQGDAGRQLAWLRLEADVLRVAVTRGAGQYVAHRIL